MDEIRITDLPTPEVVLEPLPNISLADVLNASEVLQQKEAADKIALGQIATVSFDSIKTTLVSWAISGFKNSCVILEVPMVAPEKCLDGVKRSLDDYITYVSGKTIREHVAALQTRMPDFSVSYAYGGAHVLIIASRTVSN
jgi:hypothetical protein